MFIVNGFIVCFTIGFIRGDEMKKFELTSDFVINAFGKKLFRIKALIDIEKYDVKAGDLGGYVEKEENLKHEGDAWVSGDARVYGNAEVSGDAWVYGDAWVSGDADYATVKGFETQYRNTTFFRCKDGEVRVVCGCFYGTIEDFRKQVTNTRDGKIAKEYLMIADLMQYHFEKEGD